MIDKAAIEQQLAELPLLQYDWITTSELVFSNVCAISARRSARCTIRRGPVPRRSARSKNARHAAFLIRRRS